MTMPKIDFDARTCSFLKVKEEIKYRIADPIHLRLCSGPFGAFKNDSAYEHIYVKLTMHVWGPISSVIRQIDISRYEMSPVNRVIRDKHEIVQ